MATPHGQIDCKPATPSLTLSAGDGRGYSGGMPARDTSQTPRTVAMRALLASMPGAMADPASAPAVAIFKVMGKTFALLALRGVEAVSLKCDPHLAEILREQYAGVGHRYHLDRRHWISVSLDADVPAEEAYRLAVQSYELVRAGLTKNQRADLAALAAPGD